MPRIFKERKINSSGVLGKEDFRLFCDTEKREFVPEKLNRIVKRAESHLGVQLPVLPASVYLEFTVNGNRSNYQAIYFQRRVMAIELAFAEAYEQKGRFTEKLMDVVWAIMEESSWIIPAHLYNSPSHAEFGLPPVYNEDRVHGIDLFSASTSGTLSLVYLLLKDKLDAISPIICEKMLYMLKERTIKPYLNCTFWWTGEKGNVVNNWCPWVTSNILLTTSIIESDLYTRRRVVTKAMDSLDNFTANYMPDGGCDEGPSYWGAAGASYFDCLELLYDISGGSINVYDHPLVKAMFEYIVKFNIYERRFINFADCPPSCHHDGAMIRRMGEKCGSEALIAFGDKMAMVSDGGIAQTHSYRGYRNLITVTPVHCENKALDKIWFPDLKVMVSRESTDPSKGMFVAMKGGTNGEQHNHNDVGNVVVYYNGNPVIIDTGAGEYTKQTFSPRRYELWFMQSDYHNLPVVGGVSEKNGKQYASCGERYNEITGGVSMELSGAYLPEAGLVSFVRETVLDENAEVHITDSIELDSEKEVDFHFMTCEKPEFGGEGSLTLAQGRTMLYDTRLAAEVEEFEVNDPGIERNWKTKVLYRLHFRSVFKKDRFEFIIK